MGELQTQKGKQLALSHSGEGCENQNQAQALALCTNTIITLTGWPLYSGTPNQPNDGPDEGRTVSFTILRCFSRAPRTEEIRTTGLSI